MTLEEIIEARLAGLNPAIGGTALRDHAAALMAHDALTLALTDEFCETADDRAPPALPADYELVRELGRGGMGVVYLARQKSLGRDVAVKLLRIGPAGRERVLQRFADEARHMAQLRHPNIVAVHEVGQCGGEPYFTMDYVAGESLAQQLARGPLTPTRALAILRPVAAAVQYAHEQGIIHRDLKPGNILLGSEGRALVTDFGLARDLSAGSDLTRPGELLGTPAYMAPEQARGDSAAIGEAADVHALGAILYEMLTGIPPFGNDAPAVVFARVLHDVPLPPRTRDRRIPRDLETICLKCLEKDPALRYSTVRALLEDLRRFEAGEVIAARRPNLVERTARLARRQWRLLAAASVAAILTAIILLAVRDRPATVLRAWGQEREAAGDYTGAVELYRRAWTKVDGADKALIQSDLIRAVTASDDPRLVVDVARDILAEAPSVSFGSYDPLVAQALLAELRAEHPGRGLGNIPLDSRAKLELAERRVRLALREPLAEPERRELADALTAIAHSLTPPAGVPAPVAESEPPLPLPAGSRTELEGLAADTMRTIWSRGAAKLALAIQAEDLGDTDRARSLAVEAVELLRRAFPIHRGAAESIILSERTGNRIGRESPESRMLVEADRLARRLDPKFATPLRGGGLRFELTGDETPASIAWDAKVVLWDAHDVRDRRFLPRCTVPFDGASAEIRVASGTYRIAIEGRTASHRTEADARLSRLLEWDLDGLPKTIEIGEKIVELKIPLRKLHALELLGPAAGAAHDPNRDVLEWKPVSGAARYRVALTVQRDTKGLSSMVSLPGIETTVPRVCLGTHGDAAAALRNTRIETGATLLWSVEAVNAAGRRIAVSLETGRPLLIAKALTAR